MDLLMTCMIDGLDYDGGSSEISRFVSLKPASFRTTTIVLFTLSHCVHQGVAVSIVLLLNTYICT